MVKQIFRPFWSYDVLKTEKWLSSMAEKGFHFSKLHRFTRQFTFHEGPPRRLTFRIGYDKVHNAVPSTTLLNERWMKVSQSKHWYVLSNESPVASIRTFPVREGIIRHNQIRMYLFGAILLYITVMAVLFTTIIGLTSFFQETPPTVVDSPMWILTYIYMSTLFALSVISGYSVFQLHKSNKALIHEHIKPYETAQEQQPAGQLVTRRKWAWMYAPDKLEQWLEKMEEQGYNLYRVSKTGTLFYFTKGHPRKISYCAHYGNTATPSQLDIYRDSGWKSSYTSQSILQNWSIWSCEYTEGEERPYIYSDKSHHVKHARRLAILYSSLFLPFFILQAYNLRFQIEWGLHDQRDSSSFIKNIILIFIPLLILSMFCARTWLYYRRVVKLYK